MSWFYLLLGIAIIITALVMYPVVRDNASPRKMRTWLTVIIGTCIVGGGLFLYGLIGAGPWVDAIETQRALSADMRKNIEAATKKTQEESGNAEAWRTLGRLWMEAGVPEEAEQALRAAVMLSAGKPDYIAEYAAALVMKNNGVVTEDAKYSIDMALKLAPEQPLALKLKKMWDAQQTSAPQEAPTAPPQEEQPK